LGFQLLQIPVRLVHRDLVDAAFVFLTVGDFDRLFELGAAGVSLTALRQEATFEDEEIGPPQLVAGLLHEFLRAVQRLPRALDIR